MNNLLPLIAALSKSNNPKQALIEMLQSQSNCNPIALNILDMIKNNNNSGIEMLARNMCREKGINPDDAINTILNNIRFKG